MADLAPIYSRTGFVQLPPPPPPVLSLLGQTGTSVTLGVTAVPNAQSFAFFQGTASGEENYLAAVAQTSNAQAQQITISNLTYGEVYYFTAKSLGMNNQGYGSPSNEATPVTLIYYGFVASTTPAPSDVLALPSLGTPDISGTYTLTQNGGLAQYPCIAIPASLNFNGVFEINSQQVGFENDIQFTTTVLGESVLYDVYLLPYGNQAPSLPVTIP